MRTAAARLWRSADERCSRWPLSFAVGISTAKAALSDEFAQRVVEGRRGDALDRTRTMVFTAFGCTYCGCAQYAIYSRLYPWLVGSFRSNSVKASLTLLVDMTIQIPFVYFPSFYAAQEVVEALCHDRDISVSTATQKWRANLLTDMAACSMFWIPANGVNFYFLPAHWRVPYIAVVGFVWLAGLSWYRGDYDSGARRLRE